MSLLPLNKETGPPKLGETGIGDFLEPTKLVPFSGVTITMRLSGQNNPHMFVVQFGVNSLEQSISSFDVISNKWKRSEGSVASSRLSQVSPFIAIAQLNFIKESTSYIHNTILGISNTTFT